jgi:electron transport complex protein RnfC
MIAMRTGGVSPLPTHQPLEHGFWNAAVPSLCVVPLQQHTGSRLRSLVAPGDSVREGMVIAESGSRLAVPLHAPIPGRVATLGTTTLLDGTTSEALSIELDGEFDRLGKSPEPREWRDLSPENLLSVIRTAGVVCGPRSSVPAHTYLQRSRRAKPPVVVLDVAETEPYLSADAEIAAAAAESVVGAMEILAHVLGTERLHAVVARGYTRVRRALRAASAEKTITFHTVPQRYPANTEYHLRRVVGLRAGKDDEVDLITVSPSTLLAIFDAVVFHKPQIDRVIAVGGGAVRRPAHIRVRLGTSIAEVLQECGGLTEVPARIVAGGTLTGRVVTNVNAPITKTVSAIVALTENEVRGGAEEPCIACGGCVRACPVAINPMLLNELVLDGRDESLAGAGVFDCTECGLCAHVCPSRIPLVDRIRSGKERAAGETP